MIESSPSGETAMNPISNAERFDEVDVRLDQLSAKVDEGFRQVDQRLAKVDERLADHDVHFVEIKEHFTELRAYIDLGLAGLRQEMSSGFQRLERKIDLILDKLL